MDLIRPSRHVSLGGKLYTVVIVDDFSRFTWVKFLANKVIPLMSLLSSVD